MSTRQDYITALASLVGGELPLGEIDQIVAIGVAVAEHSRQRPRIVVEDEAGNAGFDYAVSLLAAWSDGLSVIKTLEYPVDDTDETPDILQDDAWIMYQKPAGMYFRFVEDKPAATESIRVTYTAPHTCSDTSCTIKNCDETAVQSLAAAHFCNMLAAYYAQTQDSTISADSVDHTSKSREYAARARAYRKLYFDHMGIVEGQKTAASVTRDQDKAGSWAGDKLTHPKRYR